MAQTVSDIVAELPKPETLEEQYLYAIVCTLAGVTPQYGISTRAFKRKEKYLYALWQALDVMLAEAEEEQNDA